MKIMWLLVLMLFSEMCLAGLNYSKDGKILDPGMYWAIHARNELSDIKQGKGDKIKFMHNLKLSASYGFKPAMLSISAIYQNGDYGYEQDLPRAYAWWILSMGNKAKVYTKNINLFKRLMTDEQIIKAEQLLVDFSNSYSQEATIEKFEKWYQEVTAVTGSRLGGDHSYLNLQVTTNTGRILTASEFFKQLNSINDTRLDELYEVIPQEIKTEEDKTDEK